ncbi:MAG: HAD family hydrolase [Acholeplasmataceae bacterium]|nr:HAD family hydrolase [Acholeplasmataceae bacterium]
MKLVIFDLDGTILDTVKDLTSAVNHLLKHLNLPLVEANQVKAYLGQGPKYLLEHALNEPLEGELFDRYYKIYNDYYQAHQLDYTKPYEGVPKVLDTLKRSGYLLAVVSNKQEPVTKSLMEKLFPDTFDVVIGTSKINLPKPNPGMVLKVIEELKVTKEETIYIGDTQTDMKTAINADLVKIAVLYGFRTKADLMPYEPEYFVSTPLEILEIMNTIKS